MAGTYPLAVGARPSRSPTRASESAGSADLRLKISVDRPGSRHRDPDPTHREDLARAAGALPETLDREEGPFSMGGQVRWQVRLLESSGTPACRSLRTTR